MGIFRNGKFFAIHTDHLSTPRLMTNEDNKPVWQWPYSAFGNNKPTGVLKATPNPKAALTNQPTLLKATAATEMNLRFPGQYADDETGLFYNYYRNYLASQGRYTQNDPIGLAGGLNRVGYVGGDPLSDVDPFGLWAVNFDFFFGYGWGMSFGYDEETCQPFASARAGVGANFSAAYAPNATRDGRRSYRGAGSTFGMYAQGGAFFGAAGVGGGAEVKANAGTDYGPGRKPYQGADLAGQFGWEPGGKTGGGLGGSAGFEGSYYGKSDCGCKKK